MEFLDPKKQRAHTIRLLVGYMFIGLALILATTILIFQANGFGIKNGEVFQNGLVFVSSTPSPADVKVSGMTTKRQTNTRFVIPAGQYTFELSRSGYRNWKRAINVEGGVVVRFDYPFLFPSKLTTKTVKKYDAAPSVTLHSPDRRWLLLPGATTFGTFDQFDLSKPDDLTPSTVTISGDLLADAAGAHNWQLGEWSTDNKHILIKHLYGKDLTQSEYILLDREDPTKSVNLTSTFGVSGSKIELRDKAYDEYYIHDSTTGNLFTASLKETTPKLYLQRVIAFKTHGKDRVLYATDQGTPAGKVAIKQKDGDDTFTLRLVPNGTTYLLDLTQYKGAWYVVLGAQSDNRTYVFKNPLDKLRDKKDDVLVPVHILKTATPTYVAFSDNARFIMAENGASFAVYDAENDKGYAYELKVPIDAPQTHATWMDGHRMSVVSGGKLVVFEFDDANQETLSAQSPAHLPLFDRNYENLYGVVPQLVKIDGVDKTQFVLNTTALRTPEDQ